MVSPTTSPSPAAPDVTHPVALVAATWLLLLLPLVAAFFLPSWGLLFLLMPLVALALRIATIAGDVWPRFLVTAWGATWLVALLMIWGAQRTLQPAPDARLVLAAALLLSVVFALLWRWSQLYERLARLVRTQGDLEREVTERTAALQRVLADVESRAATQVQLLGEVQQRTVEMSLINELGDLFRNARTPDEAYGTIAHLLAQLFPMLGGTLNLLTGEGYAVERVVVWGGDASQERFDERDCPALRTGHEHCSHAADGTLCRHIAPATPTEALCLPLRAQGRTLGVLQLGTQGAARLDEAQLRLARMVAEQVALLLANLQLQERLRTQSVSDPLTGLYNRRYMEESLKREIRRVARSQRQLGVMVVDVDGLQRLNEAAGHEAGDAFLRELGDLFQRNIRGADIACRYDGEEFVVILPEAPFSILRRRAEQFCEGVATLKSQQPLNGQPLTLSIGIASFPEHGISGEAVFRAAKMALVRTKERGGARVGEL